MSQQGKNCSNCRWWIRYENGSGGECDRVGSGRPAKIVSDDDLSVLFTNGLFSCSMHQPKPGAVLGSDNPDPQKVTKLSGSEVIELPGGRRLRVHGNSLELLPSDVDRQAGSGVELGS